jgi:F-type H+-transporting ATPase subunit b
MKDKRRALVILLVLPLLLGLAVEEKEAHSSSVMGYVGKVVNFLVLFGGLYFLLRKPLGEFLERRAREIDSAIREAKKDRQEMEEQVLLSSERLSKLEEEIQKIRTDAQEQGIKRKEQVLQAAEKEASKIREWNRQEIDMFYQAKIRELKTQAAEWATALARRNIEEKMTPEKQILILELSIDKLEDIYEK